MPLALILLVLAAAALHAAWNIVVKAAPDQRAEAMLVAVAAGLMAGLALPFLPFPSSAAWPFLVTSALLQFIYFQLLGVPLLLQASVVAPRRFLRHASARWRSALLCGLCMTASYGVALWAMTRAPLALVAALRETSVLFATVFAAAFLKERFGLARYAAAGLVTAGAIVMKLW